MLGIDDHPVKAATREQFGEPRRAERREEAELLLLAEAGLEKVLGVGVHGDLSAFAGERLDEGSKSGLSRHAQGTEGESIGLGQLLRDAPHFRMARAAKASIGIRSAWIVRLTPAIGEPSVSRIAAATVRRP